MYTLESAAPVLLSDLKTGDHIPCVGSMTNAAQSQAAASRWCEVMNFVSDGLWYVWVLGMQRATAW